MDHKDHKISLKLRGNTDRSLGDERSKTDEYLSEKNRSVTQDAEDTIRFDRQAADLKKEISRAGVDLEIFASNTDDRDLIHERKQSDDAQKLERQREDKVREKERFQKRLIAEALLESERKETDANLLDERAGIDSDSANEKMSHDLTKTALVTRDQFLAVVSHDLKNPIGTISMSASLIRNEISSAKMEKENVLKYVSIIERSANNMDRLINDLLDVERMANGKLEVHKTDGNICELLTECQQLFAPVVASKAFTMELHNCTKPLYAEFDHDRVLQVLSNLIGNALKFSSSGGKITLAARKNGPDIEISVCDTGPGIPNEKLHQIFEKFSQLGSNDRRGLGLGLFISKWIVEAHKGRIWVTSKSGAGSTFSFTLPLVQAH